MQNREFNKLLVDEYLEILIKRKYSKNTIRNYKTALYTINDYLGDTKKHDNIIRTDIIRFLETQSNYADTTYNTRLSAIRSFYNHLIDIEVIAKQPISMQMYRRLEWSEPKALTKLEQKQYIEVCERGRNLQAFGVRLMLATGLRLSELCNLDLKKDIEIREGKGYVNVRKSKNKFPRIVPIFDDAVTQEIKELKKLYFDIKSYPLPIERYSYKHLNDIYQEKYGYRITSHQLRYTFATERFESRMDLNTIRMLMGHRTITMTLQYIANRLDIYNLI